MEKDEGIQTHDTVSYSLQLSAAPRRHRTLRFPQNLEDLASFGTFRVGGLHLHCMELGEIDASLLGVICANVSTQ